VPGSPARPRRQALARHRAPTPGISAGSLPSSAPRSPPENGCDVHLFSQPRSTPQGSRRRAPTRNDRRGGVPSPASHNPPHDNGLRSTTQRRRRKSFSPTPTASSPSSIPPSETYTPLPPAERGIVHEIGAENDELYMDRLESLLLQPSLVAAQNGEDGLHRSSPGWVARFRPRCCVASNSMFHGGGPGCPGQRYPHRSIHRTRRTAPP